MGDEAETMLSFLWPQCDGIWRPPEFGSAAAPTAEYSISAAVIPTCRQKRAVAVVEVEPVVPRLEDHARRRGDGLVTGARDLEEDLVLALEPDLLVVQPARQEHVAVCRDELLAGEAVRGAARLR